MTQQTPSAGRQPTHRIYRVIGDGENSSWTPIGAAWPNKDGHGFSIVCDAVPLQGRIVMRRVTEKPVAKPEPAKAMRRRKAA
ncbi:MAG: hypothetical protein J7483_08885 [Novosphingobium sp.]|nr:hypothetical protein [Novosphingobium sp.]